MAVRTLQRDEERGEQPVSTSTRELVDHVYGVVSQSQRKSSMVEIYFGVLAARSDRAVGRSALDASFLPSPEVLAQKEFLKFTRRRPWQCLTEFDPLRAFVASQTCSAMGDYVVSS